MNSSKAEQKELEALLEKLVDQSLSQEEVQGLERLLKGNEAHQEFYWSFIRMHNALCKEGEVKAKGRVLPLLSLTSAEQTQEDPALPAGERTAAEGLSPGVPLSAVQEDVGHKLPATLGKNPKQKTKHGAHGPRSILRWISPRTPTRRIVAAASLLLMVGLFWGFRSEFSSDPEYQVVEAIEVIRDGRHVSFKSGDSMALGESFFLKSGLLRLKTKAGVLVAVEGPADFQPNENGRLFLEFGKARVRVPNHAESFVLEGPTAKVTDLGTEFGVDFALGGHVLTEVYEGRVLIEVPGHETIEPLELIEGWAGEVSSKANPQLQTFPLGRDSRRIHWEDPSQEHVTTVLASRPEYYHRFDSINNGVTNSLVNRTLYDARLTGDAALVDSGAPTTLGEPGKCLEFHGYGGTEIPIGFAAVEESGAYTFSLWVRCDQLADQNIFVATNHLGPGQRFGPQLRLRDDGTLEHYLFNKGPRNGSSERLVQRSQTSLVPGTWCHVAITASSRGELQLYLNGVLDADPIPTVGRIEGEYIRILLAVRSGYLKAKEHHVNSFTGAVDEFAFYNRALTAEELASLYESSRLGFQEERSQ